MNERKDIIKRSYSHLSINLFVLLKLQRFSKNIEEFVEVEIPHQLLEESTRGIILTTAHLGIWEILPLLASKYLKSELFVVYREMKDPNANTLLSSIRSTAGNRVHYLKDNDPNLMKTLEEKLLEGNSIGLVADQRPKKRNSKVRFFGQELYAFGGFSSLHSKTKKPVWFATVLEENGKKRWKFIVQRVEATSDSTLLQRYYDILENLIRSHPSQYYWIHNRFQE